MNTANAYLCPLCHQLLSLSNNVFRCNNNHCFDVAKEGYVNLLPVQFKHSKQPGDNKAMVNARREFLEKHYYAPLLAAINKLYQKYTNGNGCILDAGCGEGYYTNQHKTASNQVYGVDIAKEAIKKAAKKYKQCHFSVATLSHLPFADSQFNWIYSIYAPILEQEFSRVLADQGYFLTVTPAKKHLAELKAEIYQDAKEHNDEKEKVERLQLVYQEQLSYPMTLETGEDVINLLSMTPFAFKASDIVRAKLAKQTNFTCQADFMIRLYQKIN